MRWLDNILSTGVPEGNSVALAISSRNGSFVFVAEYIYFNEYFLLFGMLKINEYKYMLFRY